MGQAGLRRGLMAAVAIGAIALATPAGAQEQQAQDYSLEAQDLGQALRAVSRQSGEEIIFSDDAVAGKKTPRLRGNFTTEQAIRTLLDGTDLVADFKQGGIVIRGRSQAPGEIAIRPADSGDIIVVGSHIRGAKSASPVTVATRGSIEDAGQSDLGSFIRTIPQNFSGGQNPTVFAGSGANQNANNSSALNLRGLGPDAALTLINGHRVAYDAVSQGVDISAIPLAAIDQIEIVADGSAALYGSDAVGGVANVRLRQDFDGVEATARLGGSADGGYEQQQYSAVTGARWNGGGFMVAGDYSRTTAILAGQRSFTQNLWRTQPIVPAQRQTSFVAAGHQDITPGISFSIDAQFNDRTSPNAYASTATTDYSIDGQVIDRTVRAFTVSPKVSVQLGGTWSAFVSGSYGQSTTTISNRMFSGGAQYQRTDLRYADGFASAELGLEGPLFHLPGGQARLAAGGGYRSSSLRLVNRMTSGATSLISDSFDASRDVAFAYAELSLPIVSAANRSKLVKALSFSAAGRYENYQDGEAVVTPKLGVIYSPVSGLAFKGSWGKSFKAQTLYQQYQLRDVSVLSGALLLDFPSNKSTFLYLSGGGLNLQPEKSTNWTASVEARPSFAHGLKLEVSYFNIHFRDRVTTPLSSLANALRDPANRDLLIVDPTPAQLSSIIATSTFGLRNLCGCVYDPAAVGVVINNRYQNASSQRIKGVDVAVDYRIDLPGASKLTVTGSLSYLTSEQQLKDGVPYLPLAGTIFDPPHWRGRTGGVFQRDNVTFSLFGNYVGGVTDNRALPYYEVGSFFSLDTVLRIRSKPKSGLFGGVEAIVSIQNLFNEKPATLRNSNPIDPEYDSTNYSPLGRVISLSLSKAF